MRFRHAADRAAARRRRDGFGAPVVVAIMRQSVARLDSETHAGTLRQRSSSAGVCVARYELTSGWRRCLGPPPVRDTKSVRQFASSAEPAGRPARCARRGRRGTGPSVRAARSPPRSAAAVDDRAGEVRWPVWRQPSCRCGSRTSTARRPTCSSQVTVWRPGWTRPGRKPAREYRARVSRRPMQNLARARLSLRATVRRVRAGSLTVGELLRRSSICARAVRRSVWTVHESPMRSPRRAQASTTIRAWVPVRYRQGVEAAAIETARQRLFRHAIDDLRAALRRRRSPPSARGHATCSPRRRSSGLEDRCLIRPAASAVQTRPEKRAQRRVPRAAWPSAASCSPSCATPSTRAARRWRDEDSASARRCSAGCASRRSVCAKLEQGPVMLSEPLRTAEHRGVPDPAREQWWRLPRGQLGGAEGQPGLTDVGARPRFLAGRSCGPAVPRAVGTRSRS